MEPTGGDDFDRLMRRLAAKDIRFRRLNGCPEHQTRALGRLFCICVKVELGESIKQAEAQDCWQGVCASFAAYVGRKTVMVRRKTTCEQRP